MPDTVSTHPRVRDGEADHPSSRVLTVGEGAVAVDAPRAVDGFAVRPPTFVVPVWDQPVPHADSGTPAPAVWLLGAHGGAGVSTLARILAPAADCGRRWPGRFAGESPFVIVVARETVPGLWRALELLRQHTAGLAGPATLLGLLTVADRPGHRMPAPVRQTRRLAEALVPHQWRIGWIEEYPLTARVDLLPVWSPLDPTPPARHELGVPREVADLGCAIRAALLAALDPTTTVHHLSSRRASRRRS